MGCTLSQTVEFNWNTDGINFGVLTLTMHQCFPVLFSLAAARGCGATAVAASHGRDLMAPTPQRVTWLFQAPAASA